MTAYPLYETVILWYFELETSLASLSSLLIMEIPESAQVDIFDLYTYFIPGSFALILLGLFMPYQVTNWAIGELSTVLQLSFLILAYVLGVLVNGAARTFEVGYYVWRGANLDKRGEDESSSKISAKIRCWIYSLLMRCKLFPSVDKAPLDLIFPLHEGVSLDRFHLPGIIWLIEMIEDEDPFKDTPVQEGFKITRENIESKMREKEYYISGLIQMRSELSVGDTYYPFHKPAARSDLFLSIWFILTLFILVFIPITTILFINEIFGTLGLRYISYIQYLGGEFFISPDSPLREDPDSLGIILLISGVVAIVIGVIAYLLARLSGKIRKYELKQMIRQLAADYYNTHKTEAEGSLGVE